MKMTVATIIALTLAACGDGQLDPRGVAHDETLLSVSATGQSETRPDEARFSAGVSTIAANSQEATRRNNETMAKVAAALTALGVGKDDIQTQRLTVGRIDYGKNKGQFEASNVVEVRVRAVDRAGAAIAATTEAGANVLSGPDLRISDREAANRSAYANAYRAARARADAYAGAAGLKIARVLAIRDGIDGGAPPIGYRGYAAVEVAPTVSREPPVSAGLTTSTVSVRVDFALEGK